MYTKNDLNDAADKKIFKAGVYFLAANISLVAILASVFGIEYMSFMHFLVAIVAVIDFLAALLLAFWILAHPHWMGLG